MEIGYEKLVEMGMETPIIFFLPTHKSNKQHTKIKKKKIEWPFYLSLIQKSEKAIWEL